MKKDDYIIHCVIKRDPSWNSLIVLYLNFTGLKKEA